MAHTFVALSKDKPYEKVFLYNQAGKAVRQVLWGDWLTLAEPGDLPQGVQNSTTWLWVRWAWNDADPAKRLLLKVKRAFTSDARPLEIIFLDVGIGDGAVLISPERDDGNADGAKERIILIDAGKTGHMREFLEGRFKAYRDGFDFHAAIITHPDADHYYGFNQILSTAKIRFKHLYHSGIVELNSAEDMSRIGGTRVAADNTEYLARLVTDDATMRALFDPSQNRTNWYAGVIGKGIAKANVGEFRMLGVQLGQADADGRYWVPGFEPAPGRPYTIEVLGPWVEYPFGAGDPTLRVFSDDLGKTKNGHSVILRLQFGHFSVLFGGDLNRPSEMFLLQQYAGLAAWPSTEADRVAMVRKAAERLSSVVMKTCHHGSSDVTDEFIQAVRPAAFVISSGDEDDDYVHPRPDLLGRLGKHGAGASPVLLSTELQRSTRDIDNRELVRQLTSDIEQLADCTASSHADAAFETKRKDKLKTLLEKFSTLALPSVSVDGAIYVKVDGNLLITAFKKESQDPKSKWFYYAYRLTGDELELVPTEGGH